MIPFNIVTTDRAPKAVSDNMRNYFTLMNEPLIHLQLPAGMIYERYLYFTLQQNQQNRKWEDSGYAVVQLDESLLEESTDNTSHPRKYWFDFTSRKISQQVSHREV